MTLWYHIFSWALVGTAALVPIVGWGYLFSYVGGDQLSAKRFLGGIVAGGLAAAIIFVLDQTFTGTLASFHPYIAPSYGGSFPWRFFLGAVGSGIALLLLAALAAAALARDPLPGIIFATKITPAVILFTLALTLTRWGLSYAPDWQLAAPFSARGATYTSLTLAFAYYLTVAAIEEISKLGHAAPAFPKSKNIRDAVLIALFVALGFAFLENTLYVHSQWTTGGNAVSTWAFRSLFSTLLHVGATAVAAWWLARDTRFWHLVLNATIGLGLATLLHAGFNTGTAAGWGWVPVVYLIAGYVLGGRALYQEDTLPEEIPHHEHRDFRELA